MLSVSISKASSLSQPSSHYRTTLYVRRHEEDFLREHDIWSPIEDHPHVAYQFDQFSTSQKQLESLTEDLQTQIIEKGMYQSANMSSCIQSLCIFPFPVTPSLS